MRTDVKYWERKRSAHPFRLWSITNLKAPCLSGARKVTEYSPGVSGTGGREIRMWGLHIPCETFKPPSTIPHSHVDASISTRNYHHWTRRVNYSFRILSRWNGSRERMRRRFHHDILNAGLEVPPDIRYCFALNVVDLAPQVEDLLFCGFKSGDVHILRTNRPQVRPEGSLSDPT